VEKKKSFECRGGTEDADDGEPDGRGRSGQDRTSEDGRGAAESLRLGGGKRERRGQCPLEWRRR